MNQFTTKYASSIDSVLSGFDRVVFRGTIRRLSFPEGLGALLCQRKVLLKDFASFAEQTSSRIKEASVAAVRSLGLPVQYLESSRVSKEEIAREIALAREIVEGPVCVLTCVEPCQTFEIHRNRDAKRLELVNRVRKCLFLYHYMFHPTFGFMNARIQTWFPFSIQVCINGREWLARQMGVEGLGFSRMDNCFVWLESAARAQELMDAQLRVCWSELLGGVARRLNPLHEELFGEFCSGYYWSCHQSEWATDVVFRESESLRRLYPRLVRYGMTALSSPDVMRFLGRKLGPRDRIPSSYKGEVVTDLKTRTEGVRVKHRVGGNSVKAYDKAYTSNGAVLRTETTVNAETDFKVYRPKEGEADGPLEWRPLRKGVADMYRRAQVSAASNDRYLNALASVDESQSLEELLEPITARTRLGDQRIRALRPFEEGDGKLLAAVCRGEFAINGLRNRDLQSLLFGPPDTSDPSENRKRSARVSRMLRMLRGHGVLAKVPHTHRYQLTTLGRRITSALSIAKQTPVDQLLAIQMTCNQKQESRA